MGGLGPGIGGMEYVVIAVVALLVVGPERLPAMLRKLGQMVAKARNMANEFRSSFDEMARQSELDDLRKEVDALRRGQSNMMPLGADAEAAFRSIRDDLNAPLTPATPAMAPAPDEWPDSPPVLEPLEAPAPVKPARAKAAPRVRAAAKTPAKTAAKTASAAAPAKPAKPASKAVAKAAPAKARASRRKAVEL
jgi:sec-independent protein translocase protein TatB